jgi:hypothetical protein
MAEPLESVDWTGERLVVPLGYGDGFGELVMERAGFAPLMRIRMPRPNVPVGMKREASREAWVFLTDDLWDTLAAMREYVKNLP